MTNLPNYNRIKNQSYVTGQDFEPIIIKNVLSEEQIEYIYKFIKTKLPDDEKWAGRKSWMIDRIDGTHISSGISARIEEVTRNAISADVKLNEFPFLLRYSPKYGYISKLFPHCDYRDSQRVTIDIQLNHDEEWPIVVEGKEYTLKYNEALIFLGTQQMHWRTDKTLKDETEIDMLIANVHYLPDRPLDENQKETLDTRSHHLKKETSIYFIEEKKNG
jgi:hypothetical protein